MSIKVQTLITLMWTLTLMIIKKVCIQFSYQGKFKGRTVDSSVLLSSTRLQQGREIFLSVHELCIG